MARFTWETNHVGLSVLTFALKRLGLLKYIGTEGKQYTRTNLPDLIIVVKSSTSVHPSDPTLACVDSGRVVPKF